MSYYYHGSMIKLNNGLKIIHERSKETFHIASSYFPSFIKLPLCMFIKFGFLGEEAL